MGKRIELSFDGYEIEVLGYVSAAHRGTYRVGHGGSPPEPSEVEDLYVGVIINGTTVEITNLLNKKQREHFEELCFIDAAESEQASRDEAVNRAIDEHKERKNG